MAESLARERISALISTSFGVGGLLLAARGTLLFRVTPYDVPTYAIVLVLLAAVAVLASYLPACRAARIEPLTALREEWKEIRTKQGQFDFGLKHCARD